MKLHFGIVEDRNDPLRLGRCRVRIFGIHSESKSDIPTVDLPWATPMMPLTGASVSGIGFSPTGPVESSIVVIFFQDPESQQIPVMLGTVPAVPQQKETFIGTVETPQELNFTKPDIDMSAVNTVTTDSGGMVMSPNESPVVTEQQVAEETAMQVAPKTVPGWTLGDTSKRFESGSAGASAINDYNNKAAGDLGGASYGTYQFASFLPKSSTLSDGRVISRPAGKSSPLKDFLSKSRFNSLFTSEPATAEFDATWKKLAATQDFAKEQHDFVQAKYYDPAVAALRRANFDASKYGPAVQDLIWSTAVQFGVGGVSPTFVMGLGESLQSATEVEVINKVSDYKIANVSVKFKSSSENIKAGVRSRYEQERTALLKLASNYQSTTAVSPTVKGQAFDPTPPKNFDFAKSNAPIVAATGNQAIGFSDESGKYPLYTKEPDTNRLARHNKIAETSVSEKESNRTKSVPVALSSSSPWDEPLSPYNAKYPHNHVYQSESGHLLEFDDTENAERVQIYHKAGTYVEIDRNGTMVRKIVGDGYEIIERNGYIYIGGRCNITVGGDANIAVTGDLAAEVGGDTLVYAGNDLTVAVGGTTTFNCNEAFNLSAASIKMESRSTIDMTSSSAFNIKAGGLLSGTASGFAYDGGNVNLNSGVAASASGLGLSALPRVSITANDFATMETSSRKAEAVFYGELPEDGTEELKEALVKNEVATKEQLQATPVEVGDKDEQPTRFNGDIVSPDCAQIATMNTYPTSLKLSPNYTLGSLLKTAVSNAELKDQFGLTQAEIVCNLQALALNVIEPIKRRFPNMIVTSCLRNDNAKSQHTRGEAVDMQFTGVPKSDYYKLANEIKDLVPFDQLLLEYKTYGSGNPWIHISYSRKKNKSQVLTLFNDKTHSQGLTNLA